jgi:vancomycin resistance protein YoaR
MKKIFIFLSMILLASCTNVKNKYQQQSANTPPPAANNPITVPSPPVNNTTSENKPLGTYSTKLTDKTPGRLHNIKLGSSILNNTTVKPGGTFSFNDTIGPRTEKTGFKEAIIFDGKGNKTKGYGGGLCQISSTLYNAALGAGLNIEERHEHSRDVPYVKEGDDATVSYYDNEDLKFKNTLDKTITIKTLVEENKLTVAIY